MLHVCSPINHCVICSYHYGWYFATSSTGNWIEQYWHPYTELQILALGYACQSRQALGKCPMHSSVPGFTLCLCWLFWRWALLLHRCLQPLLPHKSIAGCGGYHKDLRITIKGFLGKCQVQSLAWAGHSHLARLTHSHRAQLSHLH